MRQVLGPGALGRPRGSRWRGRWEGGSGWGTTTKKMHFEILVSVEKRVRILTKFGFKSNIHHEH